MGKYDHKADPILWESSLANICGTIWGDADGVDVADMLESAASMDPYNEDAVRDEVTDQLDGAGLGWGDIPYTPEDFDTAYRDLQDCRKEVREGWC